MGTHFEVRQCAGADRLGERCRHITGRSDGFCGACWVPAGHRSAAVFAPEETTVDPCATRGYRCCRGESPADSSCYARGPRLKGGRDAVVDAHLRCGNGYWFQSLTITAGCEVCGAPIVPTDGEWAHLVDAHHRCNIPGHTICTAWPAAASLQERPVEVPRPVIGDRFVQDDGSIVTLTSVGDLIDDHGNVGYRATTSAGNQVVAAPAPHQTPGWVNADGLHRPRTVAPARLQAGRLASLERAAARSGQSTEAAWATATSTHAYESALRDLTSAAAVASAAVDNG